MSRVTDPLTAARAEAVKEIRDALATASGEALKRHGADPEAFALLMAAIVAFIGKIDKDIFPGFQKRVVEMLKP